MRNTTLHIAESLETLAELEQRYAEAPFQLRRLKMLRQLADSPPRTIQQHAELLGCSRRLLHRWLQLYRKGGITALLNSANSTNSAKPKITVKVSNQLAELRAAGNLPRIEDVRDWLLQEHRLSYSVSGVWKLLRRMDSKNRTEQPPRSASVKQRIAEGMQSLAKALDAVPVEDNGSTFVAQIVKDTLERLLPDIDRVSVLTRTSSNPDGEGNPEHTDKGLAKSTIVANDLNRSPQVVLQEVTGMKPHQWLIAMLRHQKFPLHQYHPPLCYDYHIRRHIYVGSVFFWRRKELPPIPPDTIAVIEGLKDGIAATLLSLIMRHQQLHPIAMQTKHALSQFAEEYQLSYREGQVLTLMFSGLPYKQIAETLEISEQTVKVHTRNIHKRTGTRSSFELISLVLSAIDRLARPPIDLKSQELP